MVAALGPAIWERMMDLDGVAITSDAAQSPLSFDFSVQDVRRMEELSDLASEGVLTSAQQAELDEDVRASHMLALIHSKARIALSRAG